MTDSGVVSEVAAAVTEANSYLLRQDPRRALAIIAPFHDFTNSRSESRQARLLRCFVCVVTGDCHRELGQFATAADWYRRAAEHWKGGAGYPVVYAELVVRHRLDDHYDVALGCLEDERAYWAAQPLWCRWWRHIQNGAWLYPTHWRLTLKEKALLRELRSLVSARRPPIDPAAGG